MRKPQPLLGLLAGLALACASPTTTPETDTNSGELAVAVPDGTPRLLLLIVVDQMRGDYLKRFSELLPKNGGFDRLLKDSVVFTNAHHFHAATETAPGHATLATGMFPKHHGIVGNYWWDWEAKEKAGDEVYSLADPKDGVSPRNLKVYALGDRMKAAYPKSKVFAASGKDRAAILLGGHEANGAWWYHDNTGRWVTSLYYHAEGSEPKWVDDFNSKNSLEAHSGTLWTPLRPLDETSKYGISPLDFGGSKNTFPHALGHAKVNRDFFKSIHRSPFLDAYLGDFAKALIDAEDLGGDSIPDLLSVSFSALDTVGHGYGPDAPETLDTLLRLDRTIGELLDFVDARFGRGNVVVALSADHGVARVPELLAREGGQGGRLTCCREALDSHLEKTFDSDDLLADTYAADTLYLNTRAIKKARVSPDRVKQEIIATMASCPLVHEVVMPADLNTTIGLRELYRNSYYYGRSPDLIVIPEPNVLSVAFSVGVASHGSPYTYDTHVPLIIRRQDGQRCVVDERANTIDLAPSLAAILGLDLGGLDGVDRLAAPKCRAE